jgi:hypothetical protein
MPTQLSIDGRLLEGLELRGMPVAEFAVVAAKENIRFASKTKLNEAFRDVAPLRPETALALWALWTEIDEMCESFRPFKLDLSSGELTHQILGLRRAGKVFSVVISSAPEIGVGGKDGEHK